MTHLHETDVDGVRCFWVDSGRPTLAASVLFRQGTADERFSESGWLHMIEHLALHGRGSGALAVNGSVSPLITSFDAHGPAAAVTAHLASLSAWLSEPSFDQLDAERGVLRAEAGIRENAVSRAMTWRYGARGPGLSGLGEPGLGRATPESLTERARRVFNQANAILILDGPPPPDLRFPLPPGAYHPPAGAVPCDDALPAAYVENSGVVLSGVVTRSLAATVGPALVQRALKETLRDRAGAAYAPWAHYEAVDRTHAVVFAGSDTNPDLMPTLVPVVLDVVDQLRSQGPDPLHLREYIDGLVQSLADPYHVATVAFRAAHAVFEGREPQTLDEMLEEARNLEVDAVRAGLESFCATLLLGAPSRATWNDELPMLRQPTAEPTAGRRFRHRNWPATGAALVVGPDAVQLGEGEKVPSVSVPRLVGMHAFADGRRTLTCEDGWNIPVDPGEWHRGDAAVALLDQIVPAELHLPHPPLADVRPPLRMPWGKRWWLGARRVLRIRRVAIVVLVVLIAAFFVALAYESAPGAFAAAVLIYRILKQMLRQSRRAPRPGPGGNENVPPPI